MVREGKKKQGLKRHVGEEPKRSDGTGKVLATITPTKRRRLVVSRAEPGNHNQQPEITEDNNETISDIEVESDPDRDTASERDDRFVGIYNKSRRIQSDAQAAKARMMGKEQQCCLSVLTTPTLESSQVDVSNISDGCLAAYENHLQQENCSRVVAQSRLDSQNDLSTHPTGIGHPRAVDQELWQDQVAALEAPQAKQAKVEARMMGPTLPPRNMTNHPVQASQASITSTNFMTGQPSLDTQRAILRQSQIHGGPPIPAWATVQVGFRAPQMEAYGFPGHVQSGHRYGHAQPQPQAYAGAAIHSHTPYYQPLFDARIRPAMLSSARPHDNTANINDGYGTVQTWNALVQASTLATQLEDAEADPRARGTSLPQPPARGRKLYQSMVSRVEDDVYDDGDAGEVLQTHTKAKALGQYLQITAAATPMATTPSTTVASAIAMVENMSTTAGRLRSGKEFSGAVLQTRTKR